MYSENNLPTKYNYYVLPPEEEVKLQLNKPTLQKIKLPIEDYLPGVLNYIFYAEPESIVYLYGMDTHPFRYTCVLKTNNAAVRKDVGSRTLAEDCIIVTRVVNIEEYSMFTFFSSLWALYKESQGNYQKIRDWAYANEATNYFFSHCNVPPLVDGEPNTVIWEAMVSARRYSDMSRY